MIKKILGGLFALWIGLVALQMFMMQSHGRTIHQVPKAQGEDRDFFISAFMPEVEPIDIVDLSYARTGGRDPSYLAVATLTPTGLSALRSSTERTGISHWKKVDEDGVTTTGTDTNNTVYSNYIPSKGDKYLSNKVNWWTLDTTQPHEKRSIHWNGDHFAMFYIPTSETPVYIHAIIH